MDEQPKTESTTDTTSSPSDIDVCNELLRLRAQQPQNPAPKSMPYPGLMERIMNPPTEEELAERQRRLEESASLREQRSRQEAIESLGTEAGVRYRDCSFGSFVATTQSQKNALADCRAYVHACDGNNVILFGTVGTGKDHLAFSICRELINQHGFSVLWLSGQRWFGELRDAIDSQTSEDRLIKRLLRPDVLVLSDPVPQFGEVSAYQANMLFRLIDGRYCEQKPIICTANVTRQHAPMRLGPTNWDRLCHDAWLIHCAWESYRRPRG